MSIECAYRISVGTTYSSGGVCGKQGHIQDARMADSDPGDSDAIRKREPTTKFSSLGPSIFYEGSGGGVHSEGLSNVNQNLEGRGENDLPSSQWSHMDSPITLSIDLKS